MLKMTKRLFGFNAFLLVFVLLSSGECEKYRSRRSVSVLNDMDKRHLGSALNVRYGTWHFANRPSYRGTSNKRITSRSMDMDKPSNFVYDALYNPDTYSSPVWRNRWSNDNPDSPPEVKPWKVSFSDVDIPGAEYTEEVHNTIEADKRGLGSALQSRFRWKSGKRGIGSAMQRHWQDRQNRLRAKYRSRFRRSVPTEGNDSDVELLEQEDKRHLGSAMRQKFRPKKADGPSEMQKKHLGSAMRSRNRNLIPQSLLKLYDNYRAPHKKNDGHNLITSEDIAAITEEKEKRHLGSAMRSRNRNLIPQSLRRLHDNYRSPHKKNDGHNLIISDDIEAITDEKEKRHLGSAMRSRNRNLISQNLLKLHDDNIPPHKKNDADYLMSSDDDENIADDKSKRHLGSAMRMKFKPKMVSRSEGLEDENSISESEDKEKRHLGSAMKMKLKPIVASRSVKTQLLEDEENGIPLLDDKEKQHLGSAMRVKFKPKMVLRSDNLEENDIFEEEKRHLGSAMRMKFKPKMVSRSDDLEEVNGMSSSENMEKRHLGSAMRMRFKSKVVSRSDSFEDGVLSSGGDEKRHLGSAMRMKFKPKMVYRSDLDNNELRSEADNGVQELVDNDKRHMGSAMRMRLRPKMVSRANSLEEGNGVSLLPSDTEKRHLGAAMRQRFKPRVVSRSDNAELSSEEVNGILQSDGREKRHLGSAMRIKFKPKMVSQPNNIEEENGILEEEKRHLGSAMRMKFKHKIVSRADGLEDEHGISQSGDKEKRHLGSAMRIKVKPKMTSRSANNDEEFQPDIYLSEEDTDSSSPWENAAKRYLGAAMRMRKYRYKQRYQHPRDKKDDDSFEQTKEDIKRSIGSAMRLKTPQPGVKFDFDNLTENDIMADWNQDNQDSTNSYDNANTESKKKKVPTATLR